MKEKLARILNDNKQMKGAVVESCEKLFGDASYRVYYRAKLSNGSTCVVLQMPEGKSSASEEITNFAGHLEEPAFINVARYLSSIGVKVPSIIAYSAADRVIVIEDLGDRLLANAIEGATKDERSAIYKRAIDLLVDLQKKTAGGGAQNCVAFQRSFDATLLNWEFDHFLEYCIEATQGKKVSGEIADEFNKLTRSVTAEIEKMKYGFTHRDFQSRNMMEFNGALYLIDFQDALIGPRVYDLVALLRDSYVVLLPSEVENLVGYYCERSAQDLAVTMRDFHLVTVQRKMKDAGRFVYIDRVKKNPNYLKFIPDTISYVQNALHNLPEHRRLSELLRKIV